MADLRQGQLGGVTRLFKDMGDGTFAEVIFLGGGTISVQIGDIQLGSIQILGANGVDLAVVDALGRFSINLPAGAATEASLAQAVSALGNLVTSAAAASTAAKQDAGNTSLASIDGKVATAAKQDAQSTKLDTIAANVAALTKPADTQQISGAISVSNLPATQPVSGSVAVSNFPVSQPVTGPLTDTQLRATAVPVSAASLPLPSGAATSAKQDAMTTALGSPLQAGGAVSVSNFPATQPVSATALPLPTGAATETGNIASIKAKTDNLDVALSTVATAARQDAQTADLDAIKAAAQAGATAAKQDTGNASLASLDSKLPTLGQMLAKYAVPVVLASDNDTIASRLERRMAEQQLLAVADAAMAAHTRRAFERGSRVDARGRFERGTRC